MPTSAQLALFGREFNKLTSGRQRAFLTAVVAMVEDLKGGNGFRAGLRVKKMPGFGNIEEMTWAPDGRATFHFAESVLGRRPHIMWHRVGTHDVFRRP